MKLLRDLSIYTTGDYTVIETEKMCKVITRGRIGYYDKTGDPIEKLETAIENTDGHLIEDADYFDGFDHVQYRITIKEIDGSYIVLDEYSSPINYATAMIEYFSKMVENPQWVAFSTIKSTFSFSDGGKIVKITDNGKIIDVGPHVDPITYLTAEHFNKQVFKNNYSMFIPRNCQMIRLHPLEVGYACESDVVKLFKTDGLSQQWCIYDGDSNYICTDNEIILEKTYNEYRRKYELFWVGNGKKYALLELEDNIFIESLSNTHDVDYYRKLHRESEEVTFYQEPTHIIYHDGSVYYVFEFGIVSWDGLSILYTFGVVFDLYDAMKLITEGHFVQVRTFEEALVEMIERI